MRTKLHFSRFEFKYVLTHRQREALEAEIQYFVELDPFVKDRPDERYFVRSLYFDNSIFSNYYEKVDGLKHRAKFRLRTYTSAPDDGTPRFLEIKGRHNNLVFKHRSPVSLNGREDSPGSEKDRVTEDILGGLEDGPIKSQFRYELARKQLKPVMLVDYWRRPYVSKYDPEFRMTMDYSLAGTACDTLFPDARAPRLLSLPGYTILEVKFRFHVPKWFHRLIQSLELRRTSISKYCVTVETHGLAPKLD